MLVVENSFDRWRKDVFFSAAEEVQESADLLESVYRAWDRVRRDGNYLDKSEELCRELRTALGTTKWQLEEFERAVKLSHENGSTEHTIARHSQFVLAIEGQISRIEKVLRDSLIEDGKQPLRWVHLDEKERDDLALFLSGSPSSSQNLDYEDVEKSTTNFQRKESADDLVDSLPETNAYEHIKGFKDIVTINNSSKYVVEFEAKEAVEAQDEIRGCRRGSDELNTAWSSQEIGSWSISISDGDGSKRTQETPNHADYLGGVMRGVESVTKLKLFRNNFQKEKVDGHLESVRISKYLNFREIAPFSQAMNIFNRKSRNCIIACKERSSFSCSRQLFGHFGGFKRQVLGSQYYLHFISSVQVTLVLMLTVLLIAPFVVRGN